MSYCSFKGVSVAVHFESKYPFQRTYRRHNGLTNSLILLQAEHLVVGFQTIGKARTQKKSANGKYAWATCCLLIGYSLPTPS
ncbi:hypothetical protein FKM82_025300 [Ascaphus truei]